jgi:hypothetical protein
MSASPILPKKLALAKRMGIIVFMTIKLKKSAVIFLGLFLLKTAKL